MRLKEVFFSKIGIFNWKLEFTFLYLKCCCRYSIQSGAFQTLVQVMLHSIVIFAGQPSFLDIFLSTFWNILKNYYYQQNAREKWWLLRCNTWGWNLKLHEWEWFKLTLNKLFGHWPSSRTCLKFHSPQFFWHWCTW